MELNLNYVAQTFFGVIPDSLWQGKRADDIEASVQALVQKLGNMLLGQSLPKRIEEIETAVEQGQVRCEIGSIHLVQQPQYQMPSSRPSSERIQSN